LVSQKLGELGVGRKILQVNFEIATKITGSLKGGGLSVQEIFIDKVNLSIHLTGRFDVRITEGNVSSGGCQKEFKVGDDCVR